MVSREPLVVTPAVARYVDMKLRGPLLKCRERDVLQPSQRVRVDAAHEVDGVQGHSVSFGEKVGVKRYHIGMGKCSKTPNSNSTTDSVG